MVIQFIQDKQTKQNFLMEVNPRLGGAVLCSIGAGADFPGYLLDDMLGNELKDSNNKWQDNMLMVRRFKEFFIKK
jgi:carbamoyl-phosphate synthase large subunit